MELTLEEFQSVLSYYHLSFDDAKKAYEDVMRDLTEPMKNDVQVYIACLPQPVYPPTTKFMILGDDYIEANKPAFGYFPIRRYIAKTAH